MIGVSSLKIKNDSDIIVVCIDNNNKHINVFNIHNKEISSKITIISRTNIITCTCISTDCSIIVSGSEDTTVKGWDIDNGELLFTLTGHKHWIYSVDISNDNSFIISGSADKSVFLWGILRQVIIRKITHHTDTITCVKFNSDNTEILSASCDFTICLSNTKNGKLIKRFIGHKYIISNVNFNHDCTEIISTSFDGTVRLWDKKTGKNINKFEIKQDIDIVRSSIISKNGKLIISFGNRKIIIWCAKKCKILKIFECHENKADMVLFNKDENCFYSFGIDEENDILEFFEQRIPKRIL
jgi:WD40 repeat protein